MPFHHDDDDDGDDEDDNDGDGDDDDGYDDDVGTEKSKTERRVYQVPLKAY